MKSRPWKDMSIKEFDNLFSFFLKNLSNIFQYGKAVYPTEVEMESKLEACKTIIDADNSRSYFEIVDLRWGRIIMSYGSASIGYPDITLKQKISAVPPLYRKRYYDLGEKIYQAIAEEKIPLASFQQSYCINIPLWDNRNKEVIWMKQRSTPYRFDSRGNMVQHLNINTYQGRFEDVQPMTIWMSEKQQEVEQWDDILRRQLRMTSEFSYAEIIIMDILVNLYKENIRSGIISQNEIIQIVTKRLNKGNRRKRSMTSKETTRKHFTNIKQKAIIVFGEDMRDKRPQAISLFCYKEKLI